MKRPLFPIFIILSMLFSLSGSTYSVQASNPFPSMDLDQDGISNSMENDGWYNLKGGPYKTDPNKADSDDDGLTDAEEKLFNTNPMDSTSPGIAVKYNISFKTFEYYRTNDPKYIAMVQGGNQYLLTEALVIRRGTMFNIAAVNTGGASLTINLKSNSQVKLTAKHDPARGGWKVTVPTDGTAGEYTATVTKGGWTKSMPIYVIFEIPAGLTQAQIDAYLYDDNPGDQRDEVAVWWRAKFWKYYNNNSSVPTPCSPTDPGQCSNWPYHAEFGYAQAFWTEQFTKNALTKFAVPAIQGKTSSFTAAQAIAMKADESVRVNYSAAKNSFSSATSYEQIPASDPEHPNEYRMGGGACETNAGVFTSILRSAGIPAMPFAMDYTKVVCMPDDPNCDPAHLDPDYTIHHELGNTGQYEYDHAVKLWVKGTGDNANRWYAGRTSYTGEAEYQTEPIWYGGTPVTLRPLDRVGVYDPNDVYAGFGKFRDIFADLVQAAKEGWDFQNGSLGGGMVNTVWPIVPNGPEFSNPAAADPYLNRDFKWDSKYPLQMDYQSPYMDILNCQLWQGDDWAPIEWVDPTQSNPSGRDASHTYRLPAGIPDPSHPLENWPFNPNPMKCSPSSYSNNDLINGTPSADCVAFLAAWKAACTPLPGQTLGSPTVVESQSPQVQVSPVNTTIQLGKILGSVGIDQNGDGLFDQLVVSVELNTSVAGEYQLGGWLLAGENEIRAEVGRVNLIAGPQVVQVTFDGQLIGDNGVDGPYQVEALWIAPTDQAVSQFALPEEMTAYQAYTYTTQAYRAEAFTVQAASFGEQFSNLTTDQDGDGFIDTLTISVPLKIALPDTYKVEGDLYDGQGGFVGHASWTGSSAAATLAFEITNTQPPYSLEHLNLFDSEGKGLDWRYAPVYKVDDLNGSLGFGSITIEKDTQIIAIQSITPTNVFTVTVDMSVNKKVDRLVISAYVDVSEPGGTYWMEGLLLDGQGAPAVWAVGNPQTLPAGQHQSLSLAFDARLLYELPFAGSQSFTLAAVKIFKGSPGQATIEADVPVTTFKTPTYSRSQLESASPHILFEDDLESGLGKWNVSGSLTWDQPDDVWHSWSKAVVATGSTAKSGTLTLKSVFDLTDYASPWLRFSIAYQLSGDDQLKIEASTNGTNWTTLKTITAGSTSYWSSQVLDLSAYGKKNEVHLRLKGDMSGGHTWLVAIDDLFLNSGPAIKEASFSYQNPVKTFVGTTFTASYNSINTTLPVKYHWDFCGDAKDTESEAIVYQFQNVGDCPVTLTVDNSYDIFTTSPQTITVTSGPAKIFLPLTIKQ